MNCQDKSQKGNSKESSVKDNLGTDVTNEQLHSSIRPLALKDAESSIEGIHTLKLIILPQQQAERWQFCNQDLTLIRDVFNANILGLKAQ